MTTFRHNDMTGRAGATARARARSKARGGIMGGILQSSPLYYRAPILHGGHH